MENSRTKGKLTCNLGPCSKDRVKLRTDENGLNQKSGDWKYDDQSIESSLPENIAQELRSSNWKWRNPYSISDFDRTKRWHQNGVDSSKPA